MKMKTMASVSMPARDVASGEEQASSQSSAMSICMSDTTPESQSTSQHKGTCLKRKKKSRSGAFEAGDLAWLGAASQELKDDITKRLQFDDIDLNDDSIDEAEQKTDSSKKRRAQMVLEAAHSSSVSKSRSSSASKPKTPTAPLRNTCILESPLDARKSSRKRKIYGVRRNEPKLPRIRPKRSAKRAVPFALCALQRMFAE